VEDTGPGIPEELGERIFKAFVRGAGADRPGSGLGLATLKRLVTGHGGNVGFRSRAVPGSIPLLYRRYRPSRSVEGSRTTDISQPCGHACAPLPDREFSRRGEKGELSSEAPVNFRLEGSSLSSRMLAPGTRRPQGGHE